MAADWIGINSSHYVSHCGEAAGRLLTEALDGTDYWGHDVNETHRFILYLGTTNYNIQKVRGRSLWTGLDPTLVDIYVSETNGDWGVAVASNIATWQDTDAWIEIDVTDKDGRYIKVEITETEHGSDYIRFGGEETPFAIFDVYGEALAPPPTIVEPATLALALTQHAPSVHSSHTNTPSALALAATLHAPTVIIDCTVTPATFELAATLLAPEVTAGIIVTPDTFELALTQHAPGVRIDCTVLAETLELALTLQAPSVFPIVTVTPESLALAVALLSPVVVIDVTVTPDTFALALTQHAPVVSFEVIVFPAVLELEATLHAPEVITLYTAIPPFMQKDLIDPYSGGAWLWLCEIAVPGFDTQRIARNTADIKYAGENYVKWNLDIGKQIFVGDGGIPRTPLRVAQDSARTFETIMNASKGCHDGTARLIRTNEKFLDCKVEVLEITYDILTADSDWEWVYYTLGIPNLLQQRIPLIIGSSKVCPWAKPDLFKGPRCQYPGELTSCTGTLEDCRDNKNNAVHWGAEIGLDPNATRI